MPTAPGSHQPQLPGHAEKRRRGKCTIGSCCLLTPSLHSFCHCHSLPDSRRCPEPWGSSVVSGSAFPTLRPPKALGSLCAVCPQAHTPWQGWPSLAGLSGFGCSHACSDPAPGSAGCVTLGGVGGSRDGILHWSPHPSMSPGPEFGSHPPGGPRGVPSWGMWRPGWCGVTEVVLVTLSGPTPTTCGSLESPGLAGAAAVTSPLRSALGGSFITMRIPQSICPGGRAQIPHRKLCNSRSGGENPPNPGKSWSVYVSCSYARLGSPICGLSAQSLSQRPLFVPLKPCLPRRQLCSRTGMPKALPGAEEPLGQRGQSNGAGVTHGGESGP